MGELNMIEVHYIECMKMKTLKIIKKGGGNKKE
jgi:hypothetical protein